jgi:hypothetical protein
MQLVEAVAAYCESHTKHGGMQGYSVLQQVVHIVTTGLWSISEVLEIWTIIFLCRKYLWQDFLFGNFQAVIFTNYIISLLPSGAHYHHLHNYLITCQENIFYLSILGSTVLLLELGPFFSFLIIYTVRRTPWTGISRSQGRYLHTE